MKCPILLSGWIGPKSVRLFVPMAERCHFLSMLGREPPEKISLVTIGVGKKKRQIDDWQDYDNSDIEDERTKQESIPCNDGIVDSHMEAGIEASTDASIETGVKAGIEANLKSNNYTKNGESNEEIQESVTDETVVKRECIIELKGTVICAEKERNELT